MLKSELQKTCSEELSLVQALDWAAQRPPQAKGGTMEVSLFWIMVWCTISVTLMLPAAVNSAPIKFDFNKCQDATYVDPDITIQCCPPLPTKPIINGPPPPSTNYTRVRKALQCSDATYAAKLEKAYALMRALPDDDPRSFQQQWYLHCSYCGGAFLASNSTGPPQGVDVHSSWLFFPWHRWYIYFHERILQSLLGDPTFSLAYWNWDSPYNVADGSSTPDAVCLKRGHDMPVMYQDPSSSLYDVNRSEMAKGKTRLHFPDLTFSSEVPAIQQPLYNASEQDVIDSNMNAMYQAMVSGGTTAETFLGKIYRAGQPRGTRGPTGGSGSLEVGPHGAVHFWTGRDPPVKLNDMGILTYTARDPSFYAHHSNVDRLWGLWKTIGPIVGHDHSDYSDPDFLDSEFLFYDENKDLRRVTVREGLDTVQLGYEFQESNILPWLFPNLTICSQLKNSELIAQAESLPAPSRDSDGYYHLQAGTPFSIIVHRPQNAAMLEEFLTIDGIKIDRLSSSGFDVFVDLLNPNSYLAPSKCAEYSGRFTNMAQNRNSPPSKQFLWKRSVTRILQDINAVGASKLVITLQPLSQLGSTETTKFSDIKVDFS